MEKKTKHVAVTGGAGQIAYSLLFKIASGEMLGFDQPIALHILEIPEALKMLEGVKMELNDCAFPLLKEIHIGSDPMSVFSGVHYALLVGAKPRGPGMERGELLAENGKIFIGQGAALNAVADPNVKVFVVGNPCNTNCLIAMHHAPRIPRTNFHAMTRLDQNRAQFQLAQKAHTDITEVTNMTIWGNHSSTQVPDFFNARIQGKLATDIIKDRQWLEKDFITTVQKRGAAVIDARGKSSAASAAHAVVESVKAIVNPTPAGQWFSSGVVSSGNPYGIEDDLIFSFPCISKGNENFDIVGGLPLNDFLSEKIKASEKELKEERDLVRGMLS